jgi:hypothetical protein
MRTVGGESALHYFIALLLDMNLDFYLLHIDLWHYNKKIFPEEYDNV